MSARLRDVHPIIKQIIDRDCHVGESDQFVVRHVISKLKNGYETYREMPQADRQKFVDQCITQHRANQRLYAEVMNGFPACRRTEREVLKQIESVSSAELKRLMQENAVTAEYISFRLGWSIGRVKSALDDGLKNSGDVQKWLKSISEAESTEVPREARFLEESGPASCNFCGCPISKSDQVFEYRQNVYCSKHCCRRSSGW